MCRSDVAALVLMMVYTTQDYQSLYSESGACPESGRLLSHCVSCILPDTCQAKRFNTEFWRRYAYRRPMWSGPMRSTLDPTKTGLTFTTIDDRVLPAYTSLVYARVPGVVHRIHYPFATP